MVPHQGLLYFVAEDVAAGAELWRTDGTVAGTRRVVDLLPGPEGSQPRILTPFADRLAFTANDGRTGTELWTTDGTAAGTALVVDLAPGLQSSDPEGLLPWGSSLLLGANDGLVGREPWRIDLADGGVCEPSERALCLSDGRFRVEVAWRDFTGRRGVGTAVPLADDSGAFWFFDDANLELMVKTLDARGVNQHYWVFYGALSNVEYTLTMTDTTTGRSRRYANPLGTFASTGDTSAFPESGGGAMRGAHAPARAETFPSPVRAKDETEAGLCADGAERLCLGGRFAVEVRWSDFSGNSGAARARPVTDDTGSFWFFDDANLELLVKVLDGTGVNGRFWVFYGALSNVGYTITVTDTTTGVTKTYRNQAGAVGSLGDVEAF
jgi:ELWxxDGT repeat protein